MYIELIERKAFENAAYDEYILNDQTARISNPEVEFAPRMSREAFFTLEPNGRYMLVGLDSAWWAWKVRAQASAGGTTYDYHQLCDKIGE